MYRVTTTSSLPRRHAGLSPAPAAINRPPPSPSWVPNPSRPTAPTVHGGCSVRPPRRRRGGGFQKEISPPLFASAVKNHLLAQMARNHRFSGGGKRNTCWRTSKDLKNVAFLCAVTLLTIGMPESHPDFASLPYVTGWGKEIGGGLRPTNQSMGAVIETVNVEHRVLPLVSLFCTERTDLPTKQSELDKTGLHLILKRVELLYVHQLKDGATGSQTSRGGTSRRECTDVRGGGFSGSRGGECAATSGEGKVQE